MDDPIPDTWWWNDEDKVYIKVRSVVTNNRFIGPYVSIETFEKDGTPKPNAGGIGQSRWDQMVKHGDLQLIAYPPWEGLDELELEPEEELEIVETPTVAICNKCKSTDFRLFRGSEISEHRWVCQGCWATFDHIEYNIIGGDADLEVKTV